MPVTLYETEHRANLHRDFKPAGCALCHPGDAPQAPALPDTREPLAIRPPHEFVAAEEFVAGKPICICGLPRSSSPPHKTPVRPIGQIMRRMVEQAQVDDGPGEDDSNNLLHDGGPDCEVCHGTRRVGRGLQPNEPGFGESTDCREDACRAWIIQRRTEKMLGELDALFRGWTLDTFPTTTPHAKQMVLAGRQWLANSDRPWLYTYSPPGHGKTGFAVGLLDGAIKRGRTGTFQSTVKLLRRIRQTYNNKAAAEADETMVLNALYEVDLLVLDGVGEEHQTDWAEEMIFAVIGGRHDQKKQTIVTSNFGPDELSAVIGKKTVSRIQEMAGARYTVDFSKMPYLREGPQR